MESDREDNGHFITQNTIREDESPEQVDKSKTKNSASSNEFEMLFGMIKELKTEMKSITRDHYPQPQIETSPNKVQFSSSHTITRIPNKNTPMRETYNTPVREEEENDTPVREKSVPVKTKNVQFMIESDIEGEEREGEDTFNPHTELTDGYDSQDGLQNELDYSKLSYINSDDELDNPINEKFAEIINKSWNSKKSFDVIKKQFDNYKCPENFSIQPPKVNTELWKLLSSWQKKSDVKFSMIQKALKKAMNASLMIMTECQKEDGVDVQKIAQIITDTSALLSYASHEISLKRRVFIRSVINPEYKDLCATSQPMTDKLFGDDLPKNVKELRLTNTISKGKPFRGKNRYKPYYNKRDSFLGQWRGNPPPHQPSQRRVYWKKNRPSPNQQNQTKRKIH